MLKSDRLVCEKNATKAQPVTNCNLGSINSVYLIMKCIYHLGYQSFVGKFVDIKTLFLGMEVLEHIGVKFKYQGHWIQGNKLENINWVIPRCQISLVLHV